MVTPESIEWRKVPQRKIKTILFFLIIGEGCCPVTNRVSHGDGHSSNSGSERSLWEGRGKSQGSRGGP